MTNIHLVTMKMWLGCLVLMLLMSCTPGTRLTMSWHKAGATIPKSSKIVVLSMGKNTDKRKTGEGALKNALQSLGFTANAGIDVLGELFPAKQDSVTIRQLLLANGFDFVVTLRVLNINENNQWLTNCSAYTYPSYLYHGFYTYYKVYALYPGASFMGSGVKIILESNVYNVSSGELIWSGQSMAFRHGPTTRMAKRYSMNIMRDLQLKKLVTNNEGAL